MNRLENPVSLSELRQALDAALTLEDRQKQTAEVKRILDELGSSTEADEVDLQRKALRTDTTKALYGPTVASEICRGLEKLQTPCSPAWVSLSSCIIEYRKQEQNQPSEQNSKRQRLDEFIDKAATEDTSSAKKEKWLYKHDCWTARAVARAFDTFFSESKNSKKEKEFRRHEKAALLTYGIMDELYPTWGPDVILIHAAFEEQHQVFSNLQRQVLTDDIPVIAKSVAERVRGIDRSKISEDTTVHVSIAIVAWARRKSLYKTCEKMGFHHLKFLQIDFKKFDAIEQWYLAASTSNREAAGRKLDQGFCVSLKELRSKYPPYRLGRFSLPLPPSMSLDSGYGGDEVNRQENSASSPCTSMFASPVISASDTDDGDIAPADASEDRGQTDINDSAMRSNSDQTLEGCIASSSTAGIGTGQKRPHTSNDSASPKRHHPTSGRISRRFGGSNAEYCPNHATTTITHVPRDPTQESGSWQGPAPERDLADGFDGSAASQTGFDHTEYNDDVLAGIGMSEVGEEEWFKEIQEIDFNNW